MIKSAIVPDDVVCIRTADSDLQEQMAAGPAVTDSCSSPATMKIIRKKSNETCIVACATCMGLCVTALLLFYVGGREVRHFHAKSETFVSIVSVPSITNFSTSMHFALPLYHVIFTHCQDSGLSNLMKFYHCRQSASSEP